MSLPETQEFVNASETQLAFLNSLLPLLSGGYRASVDPEHKAAVQIQYGDDGSDCGFSINRDRATNLWLVHQEMFSGGSHEEEPEIHLEVLNGPSSWEAACYFLVKSILADLIESVVESTDEEEFLRQLESGELEL